MSKRPLGPFNSRCANGRSSWYQSKSWCCKLSCPHFCPSPELLAVCEPASFTVNTCSSLAGPLSLEAPSWTCRAPQVLQPVLPIKPWSPRRTFTSLSAGSSLGHLKPRQIPCHLHGPPLERIPRDQQGVLPTGSTPSVSSKKCLRFTGWHAGGPREVGPLLLTPGPEQLHGRPGRACGVPQPSSCIGMDAQLGVCIKEPGFRRCVRSCHTVCSKATGSHIHTVREREAAAPRLCPWPRRRFFLELEWLCLALSSVLQ